MKNLSIPNFPHERLMSKVFVNNTTMCWDFTGKLDKSGYGRIRINKVNYLAHRMSYDLFCGFIDESMVIDHLCRNRSCCNPDHLREVTMTTNTLENSLGVAAISIKKTHCKNGHELTPDNCYTNNVNSKGRLWRNCVKCAKDRAKNV